MKYTKMSIVLPHSEEFKVIKQPTPIRFHSKRSHIITKMDDNINMESTNVGPWSVLVVNGILTRKYSKTILY
jgi:hypothetical protein